MVKKRKTRQIENDKILLAFGIGVGLGIGLTLSRLLEK